MDAEITNPGGTANPSRANRASVAGELSQGGTRNLGGVLPRRYLWPGAPLTDALRGLEACVLWAIPTLVVGWTAALWISMTPVAFMPSRPWMVAAVLIGWTICIAASLWALVEARTGLRHAMSRWPERRPGAPQGGRTGRSDWVRG